MNFDIDMTKSNWTYAAGVVVLMLLSMLVTNIPQFAVSHYIAIGHRAEIGLVAAFAGMVMGVLAMSRYSARIKKPWAIPQAQISIFYGVFFVLTLIAIFLIK